MTKRINDIKQRKERILISAQKVFMKKGYYGTTIDDIADEEGVVRGTILHYFKSKEVLMEAVLESAGKDFAPEIEKMMCNSKLSVTERLDSVIEMCGKQFQTVKSQVKQYGDNARQFRFLFDQIRLHTYYSLCEPMQKLLEDGCSEGVFQIKDTAARAQSIVFAIFGITGANLTSDEIMEETKQILKGMIYRME